MITYIAEIGINHNGNIETAKKLIDRAVKYGCHIVKFQKRNIGKVYSKEFLESYRDSLWGKTQYDQKRGLEFGKEEYDIIDEYCKERNIDWMASAWDIDSQRFINKYNLPYNKIASPMLGHKELVDMIIREGKPTFISTGMSTLKEVDDIVNRFKDNNCPYIVMHCVSLYPCPDEKLNLNVIKFYSKRYSEVGYSGHSSGVLDGPLAVVLGARYIEKHITLDRTMYGSDQAASLEEEGLRKTIQYCDAVELMLGSDDKKVLEEEIPIRKKLRYYED